MEEVTTISSRNNEGWWAVAYDLHIHYGYETMLLLYDRFISEFHVCVERIAKAEMVGKRHSVVWQRLLFFNAKPLSKMAALKEELVAVTDGYLQAVMNYRESIRKNEDLNNMFVWLSDSYDILNETNRTYLMMLKEGELVRERFLVECRKDDAFTALGAKKGW